MLHQVLLSSTLPQGALELLECQQVPKRRGAMTGGSFGSSLDQSCQPSQYLLQAETCGITLDKEPCCAANEKEVQRLSAAGGKKRVRLFSFVLILVRPQCSAAAHRSCLTEPLLMYSYCLAYPLLLCGINEVGASCCKELGSTCWWMPNSWLVESRLAFSVLWGGQSCRSCGGQSKQRCAHVFRQKHRR